MNILIVNSFHHYRGGDCAYTFGVSNLLRRIGGHNVIHFAMKHSLNVPSHYSEFFVPEIDLAKELAQKGLRSGIHVFARTIYSNRSKENLSRLLDRYPVNIAHIQNIHRHITPSIFHTLKARKIPIVWTLHDYFLLCPNSTFFSKDRVCEACKGGRFYNAVIRKCRKDSYVASVAVMLEEYVHRLLGLLKLVDYFIAPSQFMKRKLIEYGLTPGKVIYIPHFIDAKSYCPQTHVNFSDYIVYLGRVSYEKGVSTLIKSIFILDSVKLLVVGDGPIRSVLEKKVAANNQKSRVKFLGFVCDREKLRNIIRSAAFVVFPSECYETFGLGIVEGYALGKPLIGGNIGCIPELIKNDETGLLFEPGNADDLAQKIRWLIEHPKERQEMGRRARKLVEKEYNPELHYKRLMAIYRIALKKHDKNVDELV